MPIWDEAKVRIKGYDPEALYQRYKQATDAIQEKLGSDVSLTDAMIVREMKIQDPERYGFIGQGAGLIPFWERKGLELNQDAIEHIMVTHKFGAWKQNKKTEFPEDWDEAKIILAIKTVLYYGKSENNKDGRTFFKGIFDNVAVNVMVRGHVAHTAYPAFGDGVFEIVNKQNKIKIHKSMDNTNLADYPVVHG